MRLFLDTADRNAWRECLSLGLFYGITTNPIILEKAGITCSLSALRQLATEAFELGVKEFHAQVWGNTIADFVTNGQQLAAIDSRLVVKVPITEVGIKAAKHLALDNIPLTFTGLYSAHQVITAAALGVNYAAPYLGRMDDNNRDGFGEITLMHKMLIGKKPTRLLVASLRHIKSIVTLAASGLDTFTISPEVTQQLIDEPLTDKAAADFQAAALRMTEK
jgi:transaldolase